MKRWWVVGSVLAIAVALCMHWGVRFVTGAAYLERKLTEAVVSANGVNRVTIGSSHFSPLRRSFVATDIEYLPDTFLIAQKTKAGTPTRTRYTVTVSSLRVHGIRRWSLLRGNIVADSVTVDGLQLDVYLDRTAGPAPPAKSATLPHVSFQSIDRSVRIGMIRVKGTEITYSEKARDGGRPGTIRFTDLWATIYNAANDSVHVTPSTSCTIDIRTRIADAGRLDATFGYDLLSPRLSMTCRGSVARMNAESLNELLVDLVGIRITSGVVDSTWFDFAVKDDIADGTVQVLYHDFGFQVLDKVTMDRGLMARFQTLIVNKMQLKQANPAGERTPATVATIHRERLPETPLLKFLWESLREGLLLTIGL